MGLPKPGQSSNLSFERQNTSSQFFLYIAQYGVIGDKGNLEAHQEMQMGSGL